jgi:hypothetical protein
MEKITLDKETLGWLIRNYLEHKAEKSGYEIDIHTINYNTIETCDDSYLYDVDVFYTKENNNI